MMSLYPGSSLCRSNPWPMRMGGERIGSLAISRMFSVFSAFTVAALLLRLGWTRRTPRAPVPLGLAAAAAAAGAEPPSRGAEAGAEAVVVVLLVGEPAIFLLVVFVIQLPAAAL